MVLSNCRRLYRPEKEFQNRAIMTVVHRTNYRNESILLSYNYSQEYPVAELKICVEMFVSFNTRLWTCFLSVCTYGLFTLKFYILNHVIQDISRIGSISALDALPYKQFNTVIKTAYRHTSRRRAARMDETVFCLDKLQNNAPWKKSRERNNFPQAFLLKMC